MSDVVHLTETLHGVWPVLVRQSALEQHRRSALNEGPVGTLDDPIGLVPVRRGFVVPDAQLFAGCVEPNVYRSPNLAAGGCAL